MTECFVDIEDTRKDMYRVAKQMVKMKDGLVRASSLKYSTSDLGAQMSPGMASPSRNGIHENNGRPALNYQSVAAPQTLNFNDHQVVVPSS